MASSLSSSRRAMGRVADRLQGLAQRLRQIKAVLPLPSLAGDEDIDEAMHANEAFQLDLDLEQVLRFHLDPAIEVLQRAKRPASPMSAGSRTAKT